MTGEDDGAGGAVTVLKLGGSLITDKSTPETVDDEALAGVLDAVADALADADADADAPVEGGLVVVHGGGSFGHHHASAHGVSTTRGTSDPRAVDDIHGAMKRLNRRVLDGLLERDVPAVPVHPLSVAARTADGELQFPLASVETLLGEGFVPVLHGDGIAHAGHGVTVCSGDELVVALARGLDAERVGMCSTVGGVLDGAGDVVPRIDDFDEVAAVLGGAEATDVTGGMAGKVRALLELEMPAFVFGAAELDGFLAGADVGTRVDGSE